MKIRVEVDDGYERRSFAQSCKEYNKWVTFVKKNAVDKNVPIAIGEKFAFEVNANTLEEIVEMFEPVGLDNITLKKDENGELYIWFINWGVGE